ncbi:hydrolase 1, exosortase A system-associated [Alkalilimnicola ehrlichii MLHE-1]|nr:hydrolase 1, exosortase A system-associated [Alkalilimnicola ehrlichii]
MRYIEKGVVFLCDLESLVGVVSQPDQPAELGVIILVGGPQYRVGAHRQFVRLARCLAANGISCMRFDYRGMGDASGAERGYGRVLPDIGAALAAFQAQVPQVRRVVLWGLCGGASAACLYRVTDDRVAGLILVNPWLDVEEARAKVRLKHYYARRLLAGDFWKKALRGGLSVGASAKGLLGTARVARKGHGQPADAVAQTDDIYPGDMLRALQAGGGRSAVFLSGRDYVARTFEEAMAGHPAFAELEQAGAVEVCRFPSADHTFSSAAAMHQVEEASLEWIQAFQGLEPEPATPPAAGEQAR